MFGATSFPTTTTPFTSGSTALAPASAPIIGATSRMTPFDSMFEVLSEIRNGVENLGKVFAERISGLNRHLAFRLEQLNQTMSKISNIAAKDLDLEQQQTDIENKRFDEFKENELEDERGSSLGRGDDVGDDVSGKGIVQSLRDAFESFKGFFGKLMPDSDLGKLGLFGAIAALIALNLEKLIAPISTAFKFIDEKLIPKIKEFYIELKETVLSVFDGLFGTDPDNPGFFTIIIDGIKDIVDGFNEDDPKKKIQGLKTILIDGTIKAISLIGDATFGLLNATAGLLGIDTPGFRELQLKFRNLPQTIDEFVANSIDRIKGQIKEIQEAESLPEATMIAARQIYDDIGAPVLNSLNKLVGIVFRPFMSDEYYESVMRADFSSKSIKQAFENDLERLGLVMDKLGDSIRVFANEMIEAVNNYLPDFMKMGKIPKKDEQYEIQLLESMEKQKELTPDQYEPGGFMYKKYIKQREKVIKIDPSVVKPINQFEKDFGVAVSGGDLIDQQTNKMKDKTKELKVAADEKTKEGATVNFVDTSVKKGGDNISYSTHTSYPIRILHDESSAQALSEVPG